tara:strand:- start:252 stop:386 length:135 start_codon:yes stop_codon:yes gene_type:complete
VRRGDNGSSGDDDEVSAEPRGDEEMYDMWFNICCSQIICHSLKR